VGRSLPLGLLQPLRNRGVRTRRLFQLLKLLSEARVLTFDVSVRGLSWVCLRGELFWISQFSVDVPLQEPWVLSVKEQSLATLLSSVEGGEVRSDHGKLSHFAGNGVKVDLVRGTYFDIGTVDLPRNPDTFP